jgi:hypothetical protein
MIPAAVKANLNDQDELVLLAGHPADGALRVWTKA